MTKQPHASAHVGANREGEAMVGTSALWMLPLMALLIASILVAVSHTLVYRGPLWRDAPAITITSLLGALALVAWQASRIKREFGKFPGASVCVMLVLTIFAPGCAALFWLALALNCVLDRSPSRLFSTRVEQRVITYSKGLLNYSLRLRDWRDERGEVTIGASRAQFDRVVYGQNLEVEVKPGLFGIEWIKRSKRRGSP